MAWGAGRLPVDVSSPDALLPRLRVEPGPEVNEKPLTRYPDGATEAYSMPRFASTTGESRTHHANETSSSCDRKIEHCPMEMDSMRLEPKSTKCNMTTSI
jgi:hypothetical protein